MVGFALFGAGRIGRLHAHNILRHPRAELVQLYDVLRPAAEALARETGAAVAPSIEAALADSRVQAIIIASSTDTHVDLITRGVRAGKAVFCEKPIALDLARVDACWREIEPFDPLFQIGFNRRFDPSMAELKRRLDAQELGPLRQLVITSRDPDLPSLDYLRRSGGILRDMTIHDFDMARFLLPEEPQEVMCMASVQFEPRLAELGDHDTAVVLLRTRSGIQAVIMNSRRAAYGYDQRVEALCEEGALFVGNLRPHAVERWDSGATGAAAPLLHFFVERYRESYERELDAFIEAIERGQPPPVGFEDGRRALLLAEAAYRSLAQGGVVAVPSS